VSRVPAYLDKVNRALEKATPVREEFRLVVAGSRRERGDVEMSIIWRPVVIAVVRLVVARRRPQVVRLAQGGASGVDTWAEEAGARCGASIPPSYLPDWSLGRYAGRARNGFMLRTEMPDLVVGIQCRSHSPGTINCLKQAQRLRLNWVKITEEDLRVWVDLDAVAPV